MSPAQREAALRAAVARDQRRREMKAGDFGRYAGRYHGRHRVFVLEWVDDECGYRRVFPKDSAWLWEDPTIWSTAEVRANLVSGAWKPVVRSTFQGGDGKA